MANVSNRIDSAAAVPMARRLVTARIWSLLIPVRLSADVAYRSAFGIGELDRRLLLTLAAGGASRPHALMAAVGQDKAQVSRALKRLAESGLIVRPSLRGAIALSDEGERMTAGMMRLAERRNAALIAGLDETEVELARTMVARLTDRAIALFAHEKAQGGEGEGVDADAIRLPENPSRPDGLLVPELSRLLIYLQRSAALAYKRLVHLSSFDWQVLSQVVEHEPLPLVRMILMLGRDKSQASRAVRRLEEAALIDRRREPGRRAVLLLPSQRGREVYAVMEADALRRNAFLTEGIPDEPLDRFLASLDRLAENAGRL